jgi:hypothetical protein
MSELLSLRVSGNQVAQFAAECPGPVVLGRDRGPEPAGGLTKVGGATRFVIIGVHEAVIAREQVHIELLGRGSV